MNTNAPVPPNARPVTYDRRVKKYDIVYMEEVDKLTGHKRVTYISTWKTRATKILIWLFGFAVGLFSNYFASYLSVKFPFWH